jgi:hypothetical protein
MTISDKNVHRGTEKSWKIYNVIIECFRNSSNMLGRLNEWEYYGFEHVAMMVKMWISNII